MDGEHKILSTLCVKIFPNKMWTQKSGGGDWGKVFKGTNFQLKDK